MSDETKQAPASDMDEFFDKVGTASGGGKKRRYHDDEAPSKCEPQENPGKLVQYSLYGTGFMPTSKTIEKLDAGAYRLQQTQHGILIDPFTVITDELIKFPDTKSDQIISEILHFWTLKEVFSKYGFSHKRGYLLWGPPGSGKTCTVTTVISEMVGRNGLVILADSPNILAAGLSAIRSVEPDRPMLIVWEDLDSVIDRFGESEVLSILDGESQVDNIVFIATTNYPEQLDPRLINRPSRFDRIEKIDMPSDQARAIYLNSKIGTTLSKDGIDLVAESKGMSFAHLRELILSSYCLDTPTSIIIERLKKMKIRPSSTNANNPIGFN